MQETAAEALALELERDPVGVVIGNEIHRPDGAVFVAVDAGTLHPCSKSAAPARTATR